MVDLAYVSSNHADLATICDLLVLGRNHANSAAGRLLESRFGNHADLAEGSATYLHLAEIATLSLPESRHGRFGICVQQPC